MEKLQRTHDYNKFKFLKGQRPIDLDCVESKTLTESMSRYGFLPAFPIMARPNGSPNSLEIVDGQHRFTVAKKLGLPVYYVIDKSEIDVTQVNKAQRKWSPLDYAESYAAKGLHAYQTLLDYHRAFGIALLPSASILAGTIHFTNIKDRFFAGTYQVTKGADATNFGMVYRDATRITPKVKTSGFVNALWACYWVDYFSPDQLLEGIEKRPQIMDVKGGRGDWLEAMEQAYNFQRKHRSPLKFDAESAIRNRSAIKAKP
jgi:nucleotide-binding universal stress UspA family protein